MRANGDANVELMDEAETGAGNEQEEERKAFLHELAWRMCGPQAGGGGGMKAGAAE
jgi:hypothetical protein